MGEAEAGYKTTPKTRDEVDVSPIGLAISLGGAALAVVAVFLPIWDEGTTGFASVVGNSLIQQGIGWLFVGIGISCAISVFVAYRGRRKTWGPLIAGVVAIGAAILTGTVEEWMTLCPVGESANEQTVEDIFGGADPDCTRADPGIGVYAEGVAGLLMLSGGWQIRRSRQRELDPDAGQGYRASRSGAGTKVCPDCAETVQEAARVCRYCGYRFDGDDTVTEWPRQAHIWR